MGIFQNITANSITDFIVNTYGVYTVQSANYFYVIKHVKLLLKKEFVYS